VSYKFETPFESIESAHEFLKLLADTVVEAKRDLEADISAEANTRISRRVEALRLACYKVDKLEHHLKASTRILNDLRMLRRVLLEERVATALASGSDQIAQLG
jgi:hypothetical protein